ncbi:MAG: hypothetical protein BWX71_01538 [Deltaproteobacteria bacterium ADurb.Bin072]|nr:MAG: hypothetical protein BWX71_01538 [Deltaproteobacteria bacterium ADurb.Bin072]
MDAAQDLELGLVVEIVAHLRVDLLAVHLHLAGDDTFEDCQRLAGEVVRRKEEVGQAHLEGLYGVDHLVLVERIHDDEIDGLFGAGQLGHELRSAPAGNEAEETLGKRIVVAPARALGDGTIVVVETHFATTTHGRAVDGRQRRDLEVHDPFEGRVAHDADIKNVFLRCVRVDTHDVRAYVEDEGLAGEHPALYILILLHDVEDLVQGLEGLDPPGVGDVVHLAVVHRDYGDLACLFRLEIVELAFCYVFSHGVNLLELFPNDIFPDD